MTVRRSMTVRRIGKWEFWDAGPPEGEGWRPLCVRENGVNTGEVVWCRELPDAPAREAPVREAPEPEPEMESFKDSQYAKLRALIRSWREKAGEAFAARGIASIGVTATYGNCADELEKIVGGGRG